MKVLLYGSIQPKQVHCNECGAELLYEKTDVQRETLLSSRLFIKCPVCGKRVITSEREASCPYGYDDCIKDPKYIKRHYPEWYEDLGRPTHCADCKCGEQYDNEDK